ncbi:type III secretion system chaperone family protein [Ferruginibacter sp.]
MADKPFSYVPSQQLRKDLSFGRFNWSKAEDQYKEGKYLEALCSTISYIDTAIGEQFAKDPQTGVKVLHGSMQMHIAVNNGQLQVLAPFVDITNAQKMVILRKSCEINFNVLSIARIECREDDLCFIFSCPVEACEPWKIYDILREICWTADKYDDDFVTLHKASWLCKPEVIPFNESRLQQSWLGFKQYLQEGKEWAAYWKQQGYSYVVWDVVYVTLLKIDHLCAPQGSLKNLMEANIDKLFEKKDILDLANDGIAFLNTLDNLPQENFVSQLYDISTFIPAKITGSAANVQTALKQYLTDAYNHLTKNEIISAYLWLQKAAFRMLYNYRFNETQWKHIESILTGLNNLPLTDATNKLYDALNEFYTNPRDQVTAPAPDKKEEKKGLFAGWFS